MATPKPPPTGDIRWVSSTRTSSKNTSFTWLSPAASRTGRTVTPGAFMFTQK